MHTARSLRGKILAQLQGSIYNNSLKCTHEQLPLSLTCGGRGVDQVTGLNWGFSGHHWKAEVSLGRTESS